MPHVQDCVVHWGTEPEGDPQAVDRRGRRVRLHVSWRDHCHWGFGAASFEHEPRAFHADTWTIQPAVNYAPVILCTNRRYIGLEMGSVWGRLGAQVTVVEFLDRIVPTMVRRPQNLGLNQGAAACGVVTLTYPVPMRQHMRQPLDQGLVRHSMRCSSITAFWRIPGAGALASSCVSCGAGR